MANRENKENLFLIGFSGSGKSSVGKKLANILDYNFIDTDRVIEKYTGESIDSLISNEGEQEFRKIETRILSKIDFSEITLSASSIYPNR